MKLQKRILKNGITVLFEKRETPVVSFSISNKFGASYESAEIKGISHVIEHLLFTGTTTRSHEDISREIEKKGGILNAFTSNDITSYWFKLPSEHLFIGMDILIDMLKNPLFEKTKFEKEKKVILEEIKMYHDAPQRHIHDKLVENLYESPFGIGIIGTKETVSSLSRDFVKKFFEDNYSPENFIVTIVGSANFEEICDYLEKEFERKGKKIPEIKINKINKKSVENREGLDQAHFIIGMHLPHNEKAYHTIEVLDSYLANGMSSKLFLEIREKRGLAYTVRGNFELEKNYSYYSIYVGTTKEAIKEVEEIIVKEFKDIKNITEKELKESKERIIGLKKVSSEESITVMNELLFSELFSKAEDYYIYEENINKVTLEEVKTLAKEIIKNYSTAAIVPK